MELIIQIKKDNGETVEITKQLSSFNEKDIIGSVEAEVRTIREELLPILSSRLVEHHQLEFKGEKNTEKEW